MPRPLGIELGLNEKGPVFRVRPIDRFNDKLYDIITEAQQSGVGPKEFNKLVLTLWLEVVNELASIAREEALKEFK